MSSIIYVIYNNETFDDILFSSHRFILLTRAAQIEEEAKIAKKKD
jgi:hypothetical protein